MTRTVVTAFTLFFVSQLAFANSPPAKSSESEDKETVATKESVEKKPRTAAEALRTAKTSKKTFDKKRAPKICQSVANLGSRIKKNKCMTAEEWRKDAENRALTAQHHLDLHRPNN